MKKQYIIIGILMCAIALLGYFQFGREEKVAGSMVSTSESGYSQEFKVIANKIFIFDKEKYANELVNKAIQNKYRDVRFSYDIMGYPEKISIAVYGCDWDYRNNHQMFQIIYSPDGGHREVLNNDL